MYDAQLYILDPVDIPNYVDRRWSDGQGEVRVSPVHWNLEKTTEWVSRKRIMGRRVARRFGRSPARSLANRASVSVVIIAAWLDLIAARYDDKRPAPSRNTGHRCSPNGLRISPSAFTASWLWHVGRVCKQASEHRIHTLHTTCSRHRNAICPANDSLALSVTEVQAPFSPLAYPRTALRRLYSRGKCRRARLCNSRV